MQVGPRQRGLLRLLWKTQRLSRWELHEHTGVNPNAIGDEVNMLLEAGILRECPSSPVGPGRPRVPLEIDPQTRHVAGLSISPGRVEGACVNLRGLPMREVIVQRVDDPGQIVPAAASVLQELVNDKTLAVGFSTTGSVDPSRRQILRSSVMPGASGISVEPIYEAAAGLPIVLENDMHALGAHWLLDHVAEPQQDAVLVSIRDGQLGAALLIGGRPNRGCVRSGNELGHTALAVETDLCYCGHVGCLERIWSTPFLHRLGGDSTLMDRVAAYDGSDTALSTIIRYLGMGLANAINFIRPHRMVLISELTRYPAVSQSLLEVVRQYLMTLLKSVVVIEAWEQPLTHLGETAAWLSSLYHEGWGN